MESATNSREGSRQQAAREQRERVPSLADRHTHSLFVPGHDAHSGSCLDQGHSDRFADPSVAPSDESLLALKQVRHKRPRGLEGPSPDDVCLAKDVRTSCSSCSCSSCFSPSPSPQSKCSGMSWVRTRGAHEALRECGSNHAQDDDEARVEEQHVSQAVVLHLLPDSCVVARLLKTVSIRALPLSPAAFASLGREQEAPRESKAGSKCLWGVFRLELSTCQLSTHHNCCFREFR